MKCAWADKVGLWNVCNEATGENLRVQLVSNKVIEDRVALGTGMYPRYPRWIRESGWGKFLK